MIFMGSHGHLSELNSSIVGAPVASNVTRHASLNAGINENLLPFSHEAVVAEVAADADLATFQSFRHRGFVAGIGFENGNVRVRTELCRNLGGIADDTVDLNSWILVHEVRGDELAQTRTIGLYVVQESISIIHADIICMLLSFLNSALWISGIEDRRRIDIPACETCDYDLGDGGHVGCHGQDSVYEGGCCTLSFGKVILSDDNRSLFLHSGKTGRPAAILHQTSKPKTCSSSFKSGGFL
jgi:hypothetical protein